MNLVLSLVTSVHIGFQGHYDSIHPHARLEYLNFALGGYINSEQNLSKYASYRIDLGSSYLEAGIVSGYSEPLLPLFRAGTKLTPNVDLFVTPGYEVTKTSINKPKVVIGLEVKFKK